MLEDMYSRRLKLQSPPDFEVYEYEIPPEKVVNQAMDLIFGAADRIAGLTVSYHERRGIDIANRCLNRVRHEHGIPCRDSHSVEITFEELRDFAKKIRFGLIDFVEVFLRALAEFERERGKESPPTEVLKELFNLRFREGGYGFQIEDGIAVRMSDTYQHAEIVLPAMRRLLGDTRFVNANKEFLKAHEHLRKEEFKACLVECGRAFETTMKTICKDRGLTCLDKRKGDKIDPENATASQLIEAVYPALKLPEDVKLQAKRVDELYRKFEEVSKETVAVNRNKAAHGEGVTGREFAAHHAAYQIHLTAAVITFLVDSLRAVEAAEKNPPQ